MGIATLTNLQDSALEIRRILRQLEILRRQALVVSVLEIRLPRLLTILQRVDLVLAKQTIHQQPETMPCPLVIVLASVRIPRRSLQPRGLALENKNFNNS